jgi:hypothetical protein
MPRRFAGILVGLLAVVVCRCASSQQRDPALDAAAQKVALVIDRRYVSDCQFLKWLPYRSGPLVESDQWDSREVVKAGGNVIYLPGDQASFGRYAAYRCDKQQLRQIPRIVSSQ